MCVCVCDLTAAVVLLISPSLSLPINSEQYGKSLHLLMLPRDCRIFKGPLLDRACLRCMHGHNVFPG